MATGRNKYTPKVKSGTWGISKIQFKLFDDQFTGLWMWTIASLFVGALGSAGVYVTSRLTRTRISELTADTTATAGLPFYIDMLSDVGIMMWSAAAAVFLLAALLLYRVPGKQSVAAFLLSSGLLTLLLALDDAFLLHEEVFPLYLNIPELAVYAGYGFIVTMFALVFARQILSTNYLLR